MILKRMRIISLLVALTCLFVFTVPASASETRESAQLTAYRMEIRSVKDTIDIYFNVAANGIANKLGCETIYVYRDFGLYWAIVDFYDEDDPGMSSTNAFMYGNTISSECVAGEDYKIEVTIYAENNKGRDTRTKTFYVTAE